MYEVVWSDCRETCVGDIVGGRSRADGVYVRKATRAIRAVTRVEHSGLRGWVFVRLISRDGYGSRPFGDMR